MADTMEPYNIWVSTSDNPYNYFTQFDDWYAFDTQKGYNTCAYVARLLVDTDGLDPLADAIALEQVIDQIIDLNITGNYVKVYSN